MRTSGTNGRDAKGAEDARRGGFGGDLRAGQGGSIATSDSGFNPHRFREISGFFVASVRAVVVPLHNSQVSPRIVGGAGLGVQFGVIARVSFARPFASYRQLLFSLILCDSKIPIPIADGI